MAPIFDDIIVDINAMCGPCANPAAPTAPLFWEKLVGGVWTQMVRPDTTDPSIMDGDQWRYVCPDSVSNVITISIPSGNLAQGLDAAVVRTVNEGSVFDLSDFTCSDGTPIDEWQVSFDNGVTWISGFTPNTVGDVNWDCTKWRFRCDADWSDADLTYDIVSGTNSYVDTTISIDQGVQGFFNVCMPCGTGTQVWQFRIDDAFADIDHVDAPNVVTGDRPNSDPGTPTPDDAWQTVGYYGCKDCATFNIEEIWPDGLDPDNQLGEVFVFYMRVSCDNGVTYQPEIKITMES